MHSLKHFFMAGVLVYALSACSAFMHAAPPDDELRQESPQPAAAAAEPAAAEPAAKAAATTGQQGTIIKPLKLSAGQEAALAEKPPAPPSDSARDRGGMIALNFDNADIFEVINALSEFLGINYIIDPAIKGKVNIHTTSEVDKQQLLAILETVFELNNISVVKQGPFYKILPSKDAQKQGVQVSVGREAAMAGSLDRMAIQIIPLKYVPSAEVVKAIKPFSSKNGELVEFSKANIIILFDTAANIQKILKLVSIIDSDAFEQNEVRFFKVKNADVNDLAKELESIFTSIGIEKASGKTIGLGIVPVERAGMVVAVTSIAGLLDQVQHWVEVLDTIDKDADDQIFIYFVENGKAEEIADIVTQLYGGQSSYSGGSRSDRSSRNRSSRSSGSSLGSRTSRSSRYGSDSSRASRTSGRTSRTGSSRTGARTGGNMMDEDIMIVTDETTNAIIVRANAQDYAKIRDTIQRLDIIPRQVLIEVFIGEVTLSGDTQFGVEWAMLQNKNSLGGYEGTGKIGQNFGNLATALSGGTSTGFTYLFQSDRLQAFLLAQASENKVHVLSTPNIIASDNTEARIEVGQEVPIVTSEYVPLDTGFTGNANTSTSRSIEYRNTGVILEVTPRINDKGLVAMDISQEVSKAVTNTTSGVDSPLISNRKAETSVVVQNGQTVVIGGIINDDQTNNKASVPFLAKIPLISYLFSSTNNTWQKTELLILLTPHVIKNVSEAEAVTAEYREKMMDIKRLMHRNDAAWKKTYQQ